MQQQMSVCLLMPFHWIGITHVHLSFRKHGASAPPLSLKKNTLLPNRPHLRCVGRLIIGCHFTYRYLSPVTATIGKVFCFDQLGHQSSPQFLLLPPLFLLLQASLLPHLLLTSLFLECPSFALRLVLVATNHLASTYITCSFFVPPLRCTPLLFSI